MMNLRALYAILGLGYAAFAQASTFDIRFHPSPTPGLAHSDALLPRFFRYDNQL